MSGAVFVDTNGDGRRDAGETGMAGVVVTDGMAVVTTDAAGNYALPDVHLEPDETAADFEGISEVALLGVRFRHVRKGKGKRI